jgi:hypothetical protein
MHGCSKKTTPPVAIGKTDLKSPLPMVQCIKSRAILTLGASGRKKHFVVADLGWLEETTMLGTILIIILILLLIGALPTWPYSSGWGYYPGGGVGLILIIVVVLILVGRI